MTRRISWQVPHSRRDKRRGEKKEENWNCTEIVTTKLIWEMSCHEKCNIFGQLRIKQLHTVNEL